MRLIDKLVLRELVGPFLFGVAAFTSVFFAATYIGKLTNWLAGGMSPKLALEIMLLLVPSIMFYTLPMSALLSVLLAMGRLSGDSEIVALYAGGTSLYRIAAPVIAMGVLISGFSIVLNEMISPRAYMRYQDIQAHLLKQTLPTDQPFTVRDDTTNSLWSIKGGMDSDTGLLRDITVIVFTGSKPTKIVHAPYGIWAGMTDRSKRFQVKLYGDRNEEAWWQLVGTDSGMIQTFNRFQTLSQEVGQDRKRFSLLQRSSMRDSDQLSFRDLSQLVAYQRKHPDLPPDQIRKLEVNRWNRLAFPLASLVFAMLATPLGIRRHRSASSVGFGLSVLVILVYWLFWSNTSSLATQGTLSPVVGAFSADVLGIVSALALVRRAAK